MPTHHYGSSSGSFLLVAVLLAGCGGGGSPASSPAVGGALPVTQAAIIGSSSGVVTTAATSVARKRFLGAFFRAIGTPPYGVFSAQATTTAPNPYPAPKTTLFGAQGYCDEVAANGVSISSGLPVDATKLADIVNLGVTWARMTVESDYIDETHIYGANAYAFQTLDSAQCALERNNILPVVEIDAGPVEYDATPNSYSPTEVPLYESASDFGAYCAALAKHQNALYTGETRYSIPENEVNTSTLFPGGAAQIASYTEACYKAIKAAAPNSFVYAFELNMEANVGAASFISQMYALGCKKGTCYDGISIHLYLPYPIPPSGTPCFPNPGGNYDAQCVTDVRTAAHAPDLHVAISETAFMVAASVPNEQTKGTAVVAAMNMFAQDQYLDGVNYANVDECAEYPTGYFSGACLISVAGVVLPAYSALQSLATAGFTR